MILVSGSIADFSWTLEAAWLAVCRHHVLLGSKSGQTHSFTYTHIHTPPVPLIPEHVTRQTWDLVILPTSEAWAQHSGSCCSDLPWWNLRNPSSRSSSFPYYQYSKLKSLCFSGEEMALPCALNMEVINLDFLCCLLCGFLITDVDQNMADSYLVLTFCTKYLSQEEMEPVGSEFNL